MKILHVESKRYSIELRVRLSSVGEVDFIECDSHAEFLRVLGIKPYSAVFIRLGVAMNESAFAACPSLRWVVTPTTGLDHIDLDEAARHDVDVISLQGETEFLNTVRSTAEHTWALLLALLRKLTAAHNDVLAGNWRRDPFLGEELAGKKLGIIGVGRLGRMVAGYGLAFLMEVLVHDISEESLKQAPIRTYACSLDDILTRADIITLHLPLNRQTVGYISSEQIEKMKTGVILINTARGELIDESALLSALKNGRLAGFAADVINRDSTWFDSVPEFFPLLEYARSRDNIILSPHIGGYSRSSIESTRRFIVEKFIDRLVHIE